MNVLFFVEPLVLHNRPFHYWAWLGIYADMARALEAAGCETRVVVNEPLAVRATAPLGSGQHYAQKGHGLSPSRVVALEQTPIRKLFQRPNVDILKSLHARDEPAAERAYAELLREKLPGFVPDVMLALTPAPQLSAAFPEALRFSTETAAYSRAPFPMSIFFDPAGMWDQSLLCRPKSEFAPRDDERRLLARFRERFTAFFRATTPFRALEAELRQKYSRIACLPLQFGGEAGFDLNGAFRNQGEYLWHVLEQLPRDIALLVVEHPTAHWVGDIIDEETRRYLAEHHPRVRFVDFRTVDSAGQYLIHHADFVIGLSTSLAIQALLFEKPVVSVGHGHIRHLAQARGLEAVADGSLPRPELDDELSWLLSRYFVPLELARQASWLVPFLTRSLERARLGVEGPRFLDPVAPVEALGEHLFRGLSRPALRATLQNGSFSAWPDGPGPFGPAQSGPEGWQLLEPGGGVTHISALLNRTATAGIRLERTRTGSGPTLLLQRVPDLRRSAGCLARLRFQAKGTAGATCTAYFYPQFADGLASEGTRAQEFQLSCDWQEFTYVAAVPELGNRSPQSGHHLEVVFLVPKESGEVSVELRNVSLEPIEC
ncbi:MAG TPA: hypothetical protein VGK73_10945 [Polyangiaceae bacterium]